MWECYLLFKKKPGRCIQNFFRMLSCRILFCIRKNKLLATHGFTPRFVQVCIGVMILLVSKVPDLKADGGCVLQNMDGWPMMLPIPGMFPCSPLWIGRCYVINFRSMSSRMKLWIDDSNLQSVYPLAKKMK